MMAITGGFGIEIDLGTGQRRQWVMGRDGVKRWADTNAPTEPSEAAFERWRDLQPHKGATERERTAFLAGFHSATKPAKTMKQLEQTLLDRLKTPPKDLPIGACSDCDGEGEQGGQFCGGSWKCLTCGGTGKFPNA
jgi:hypothetical protein